MVLLLRLGMASRGGLESEASNQTGYFKTQEGAPHFKNTAGAAVPHDPLPLQRTCMLPETWFVKMSYFASFPETIFVDRIFAFRL